VVSGDRRIQTAARKRGSRAVGSDEFWQRLVARRRAKPVPSSPAEKPTGPNQGQTDYWLREFHGLIPDQALQELTDLTNLFDEDPPQDS
jgi:hypothetical protein